MKNHAAIIAQAAADWSNAPRVVRYSGLDSGSHSVNDGGINNN